jgi:FKBP-type peptidyl-prolyl cis-trans isomerase
MQKSLVLALVLTSALTACSGSNGKETVSGPSQTPGSSECAPSGSGTTDLTKKPVVTVPKTPAPTETTLIDIVCGTGDVAKDGSSVKAKYVGLLYADGTEFDSSWKVSPSNTFEFTIGGNVIPGFSKGATGMRVGGRREVIIPSKDGYGDQANGPIPAGATLIFVIDLVSVS